MAEASGAWLRRRRDQLKKTAATLLPDDCATRWCGRGMHHGAGGGVDFYARRTKAGADRVHAEGLTTCGLVWSCPECQARIMRGRADDVRAVVNVHRLTGLYRQAMQLADPLQLGPAPAPALAGALAGPMPLGSVETALREWATAHPDAALAVAVRRGVAGAAFPIERDAIAAAFLDSLRAGVYMLTLTLPHWAGQRLAKLRRVVMQSWARLTRGDKGWSKLADRMALAGFVRSQEVTVGERNGWHPHLHVILLADSTWSDAERHAIEVQLFRRWCAAAEFVGHELPTWEHGIDLSPCHREEYVAKLGLADELARQDTKRGRDGSMTPTELLAAVADTGDRRAATLWREYARAMKGARAIEWSRGRRDVRARYGFTAPPTEEELAATQTALADEEAAKTHLVNVPAPLWSVVTAGAFNARTLLCEAHEEGAWEGFRGELHRLFSAGWTRTERLHRERAAKLREEWGDERAAAAAVAGEWPPDVLAKIDALLRDRAAGVI